MIPYSESNDFKEHESHINTMYASLGSIPIHVPDSARVLDVGGGLGMHACFLAQSYSLCYCLDIIDYQSIYSGEYYRLFKEKCERNSIYYNHKKLKFIESDAMNIIFRNNYFDFTTSFNALEHIPDPLVAIEEMIRVTKVSGIIYLTFDPIWTADTGSHFIHRVPEPWAHLVENENEFIKKMQNNGATDSEVSEFKYGMNQLRLSRYHEIFNQIISRDDVELLHESSWAGFSDPSFKAHPNFKKCIKLGYNEEELETRGLKWILQKTYNL